MEAGRMNQEVLDCVYAAIDEANEDRQGDPPLEKSLDTPIQGTSSGLDSLGLVNFVVAVEENVERDLGVAITLSDDRSLSRDPSPFDSVGALVGYIDVLLDEQRR
jgi:acyl carrier protein